MTPPTPGLSFAEKLDALIDASARRHGDWREARAAVVAYVDADKLLIDVQDRALVASEADVQRLTAELAAERQRAEGVAADMEKWFDGGIKPDEWKLREWVDKLRAALTSTGPVGK